MDSFVLVAYASVTASRTLLQQLLAYLNFALSSEDLSEFFVRDGRSPAPAPIPI